jgi:hypothetical protein
MRSTVWNRFVRTSVLLGIAALVGASVASARPAPDRARRPRALNLFASSGLLLEANRIQCGIDNVGQVCVAFSGSPVGGGGFWPKGTKNQYIFNSGLQIAAVVDPAAVFPGTVTWAGDTAGTWFFDPRGDQAGGDPLGSIYNSLDPADLAAWPNGAVVRDAAIYNSVLLNQKKISDGDSWVRYWEGNPIQLGGREHPMGIMVEQRSLAWNFPVGNEDIIYFVFTFYNVTAKNAAAYAGLDPAIRAEVAAIGTQFQDLNEAKFPGLNIPDGGYTLTDVYAAFGMDADVAVFSDNYSTAFLPFNIGSTYSGTFLPEVGWRFEPTSIYSSPFFAGSGFIGVKYLKSPESSPGVEVGLTLFSNTTNGGNFPDAVGDHLLYRRLSGYLGAADIPCSPFTNPATARARRLCFLSQTKADARFYQASGPFDLAPGASSTIVVAYIQAAPVSVAGVVPGADNKPGIPATGDSIFARPALVRPLERVAGWVSATDDDSNQVITQKEVTTVPRSLLNKALVAQAVFDAKFLLPNAPAAPPFFLVPGSNQVTVVWQKSATEADGDLYYTIASAPFDSLGSQNALYDPNFRQFDVEGYRVYRGRTSSELTLLAQFDYTGTSFIDYTGAVDYGDRNGDGKTQCAPELGIQVDCPVTFDTAWVKTASWPTTLTGQFLQVKAGDRVELANGDVINLAADTAITGGGTGFSTLRDTDVSFAYTDNNVRNGFTYQYAVTAFDVNSSKSGPSSLESTRITRGVTPRAPSGQETAGSLASQQLGAAGEILDPSAPMPDLDPATGIFAGPIPPADGFAAGLAAFVPQVLATGALTARMDSITIGTSDDGLAPSRPTLYYLTITTPLGTASATVPLQAGGDITHASVVVAGEVTRLDSAKSIRFGGDQTYSFFGQVTLALAGNWEVMNWGRGYANAASSDFAAFTGAQFNGPRLWLGTGNEDTPNPNGGQCPSSVGAGCGNTSQVPDITLTAGRIANYTIWHPSSYYSIPNSPGRIIESVLATVTRAADFRIYWGAGGAVDSVMDVTHRVPVRFSPTVGATWGILNQASFAATNEATTGDTKNALLTWADMFCVGPVPTYVSMCGGAAQTPAVLQNTAALSPIAIRDIASSYAGTAAAGYTATGNGFVLYLAGHFFFVQGAALPAAGTVWSARFYSGIITGSAATASLSFSPRTRSPNVPGLRAQVAFVGSTFDPSTVSAAQMDRIHTVPDPYYVTNALETTANQKVLNFVNLPARAIIRIYSVSGVLVNVLTQNDPTSGGQLTWNLRNRNNQFVASGVYFYHVEAPDGKTKIGRFTVVNFAP